MQNDAAQIIDALGGTTAVAREIGAPITTVHSWRKNGIPSWRKPALDALAAKKLGNDVRSDDIISTPSVVEAAR